MALRNLIMWALLLAILILIMSTGVQAQELRKVPANVILEQIENGEDIYLENVRISGELNLSKIELERVQSDLPITAIEYLGIEEELKIVESKITIRNSVIENDIDFSSTLFRKRLDFIGTSLSGKANFRGASFSRDADFSGVNFGDNANFESAIFSTCAWFGNANFSRSAWFDEASFTYCTYFSQAIFGDSAYFGGVSFNYYANFVDASFNGDAFFSSSSFSGGASFSDAYFSNGADFGGASFDGSADFYGSHFSGLADFQAASFSGFAHFEDASFSGDAQFDYTEFNRVSFSNTKFGSHVILYGCDFNRMEVSWSSIEKYQFDGPTYIKLIKNFREREQFDDADDAYYQYRRLSQANKERSFSKLGDIFMWVSCGYGVKPHYTIGLGVVLILVFALIYWLGKGIQRLKESDGDSIQVSFWDAIYFSMVTFTTVGYGDWYPADRYRKFVMIEGLVGWLTLALFLVTLANVMIRP